MNVFVLCTGRCGSMTFAEACSHAVNYTTGHESGRHRRYDLKYPADHIEVDNRFPQFWETIGARGNLRRSLAELEKRYNAR